MTTKFRKLRGVTGTRSLLGWAQHAKNRPLVAPNYLFIGVDLHKQSHTAVLCDCFGEKLYTFKVQNSPLQFPLFLDKLNKQTKGKEVIFGLEDCNFYGRAFAKYLLKHGFIVKEVNSSYTDKKRKAGTNRNKTDELDAQAICKNLIMEFNNLPFANPQDIYWTIKQTLNSRNNYVQMASNVKICLHNLLVHHYPNYKSFFKDLDSKTSRHFFYKYPSPELLMDVDEQELTQELKVANRSVKKDKALEILTAVESAGYWENSYQEERNDLILSYIDSLNRFIREIEKLEQQLDLLIAETCYPLKTIDGVDTVLAATFIANIGDISRFKDSTKIAKIAGIAPIEHSSGDSTKQYANKLGNRELNKAFYSLALTQIRKDINPIMHEYYQKKIKEGRKKKHAMVFVERRLVNIVFRVMKDKKPYVPPIVNVDVEQNKAAGQ